MNNHDAMLRIQTFGCFSMSVDGSPVATYWPDEMEKELFCSLLSPLDLTFTWDRLCRSLWGEAATPASMRKLEETVIRPLKGFLINEIGFNPLISGVEGLKIDSKIVYVDALEFYSSVLEALRLLSLTDNSVALEKFNKASSLYAGRYLPGISGSIIANTRNELESLYRTALRNAMPLIRNSSCSV
jgi:two-component SAPR family response regulator